MLTVFVVSMYDVNNDSTCCLEQRRTQRTDDSILHFAANDVAVDAVSADVAVAAAAAAAAVTEVLDENNLDCGPGKATSAVAPVSFDADVFFVFFCSVI